MITFKCSPKGMRIVEGMAEMGKKINAESPRESVVRQLKNYRKDQGMTQEQLAERVGTKKSNISRLESGRYNPSLDFLVKVADGLGKQIQMKVK
jgi:DNA-binding XRE family transcriptional regulator